MTISAFTYDKKRDPYIVTPRESAHTATKAADVVPSDTEDLPVYAKALFIGTAGDLCVIPVNQGTPVIFHNHPVGYFVACRVGRVCLTGTNADQIVALYD